MTAGASIVRVQGMLDAEALRQLQHRCRAERDRGTTALVLDFTGMTGCPSALFMVLSHIAAELRRHACSVELMGLVEALTAIVAPGTALIDQPVQRGSVVGHGRSESE